jgi:hypothetical protein
MLAYILYNKDTAEERLAAELGDRIKREQVDTEFLDADSPRGIQLAEHYDVVGRPAVILVAEDGVVMQMWQGQDSLPSPADVSYLAHQ